MIARLPGTVLRPNGVNSLIARTAGCEQNGTVREIIRSGDREGGDQLLVPNLKNAAVATCNGGPRSGLTKLYSDQSGEGSRSRLFLYVPRYLTLLGAPSPDLSLSC